MSKQKIHLGMILDGNRRYSKKRGIPEEFKHLQGTFNALRMIRYINEHKKEDVQELTLYALSLDNVVKRDKSEIKEIYALLGLFLLWLSELSKKEEISIRFVGSYPEYLPENLTDVIDEISKKPNGKDMLDVNIALCYDGRKELDMALSKARESGGEIKDYLYLRNDIDLVIRTGGNQRTSGFFPWHTIYAEWFFSPKMWPEYNPDDLDKSLTWYYRRQRRFGR